MKVAIVGLGKQNLTDHIPTLLRRKDIEIVCVCDPIVTSHESFKKAFPSLKAKVKYLTDFRDISSRDVDFCVISVPHAEYFEIATFLCSNKIPFMKEKPFARNLDEAHSMAKIPGFEKYGFICTQRRFNALYKTAKNSIAKIGTPFMFSAIYKLNIPDPAEGWRGDQKIAGGGCILDMGYHIIDQLMWWFGKPDKFFATKSSLANSKLANKYTEDSAVISFRYKPGLHGTVMLSRSAGEKFENYTVYGSNGYIEGNKKYLKIKNKLGEVLHEASQKDDTQMMDDQLGFFLNGLNTKSGFSDTIKTNIENMKFIEACYRSSNEVI